MKLLALDFESGGIMLHERGPVTLGLAIMEDGEVIQSKEWLFAPIKDWQGKLKYTYTENARQIHGYTLEAMTLDGLSVQTIYREVGEFLGGVWSHPIVSHNAPFDSDIWSNFMFNLADFDRVRKVSIPVEELLIGPWIDTKRIAQATFEVPKDVKDLKLDTLCQHVGLGGQGEIHGAEKDAILAGKLYFKLRELRAVK